MRLADSRLCHDFCHDLNSGCADHVHDSSLLLGATSDLQLRSRGALAVLAALAICDRRALGADAAANDWPGALRDVGRALPACSHLGYGISQGDLHRLRKALL